MPVRPPAKLLVVSVDALHTDDLPFARTLPGFARILSSASVAEIEGIFPTNTYPNHAAQITGCPPAATGIYNNQIFQPARGSGSEWFWDSRSLQVPTIFAAARAAGMTTAAVQWPVTGNEPDVDWLVPEIASPWVFDGLEDQYRQTTNTATLERYILPNLHLISDTKPRYARFIAEISPQILAQERPDLMVVHLAQVDAARHAHGTYGPHVQEALRAVDDVLCTHLDVLEAAGELDTTNIVIVSDHGHIDVEQRINLNRVFADRGFLRTNADGALVDYDVYCAGAGLSGQLFLADDISASRRGEVEHLLTEIAADSQYRIVRLWTAAETDAEYGLDGPFSWVVETEPGVAVGASWTAQAVLTDGDEGFVAGRGSHGHTPQHGGQPVMIATGPGFVPGLDLGRRSMLQEAPTFAAVLGIELPHAVRSPMTDLLADRPARETDPAAAGAATAVTTSTTPTGSE